MYPSKLANGTISSFVKMSILDKRFFWKISSINKIDNSKVRIYKWDSKQMFEQDELGYQRLSPGDPVCPAPASSARHGFAIYALCCVDSKVVTEYTTSNHSHFLSPFSFSLFHVSCLLPSCSFSRNNNKLVSDFMVLDRDLPHPHFTCF